jgi:hypothetical protein
METTTMMRAPPYHHHAAAKLPSWPPPPRCRRRLHCRRHRRHRRRRAASAAAAAAADATALPPPLPHCRCCSRAATAAAALPPCCPPQLCCSHRHHICRRAAAATLALPMPPPRCLPSPRHCCGHRIAVALPSRRPLPLPLRCCCPVHCHRCWLSVVFYPSARCSHDEKGWLWLRSYDDTKKSKFVGGDALASTDASEPPPHNWRYTACRVGLGRGRGGDGHPWLALFFARVAGKLIVTEVSSSLRGKNACAGQFLAVKPTLGVDFSGVVAHTSHTNVPLRR